MFMLDERWVYTNTKNGRSVSPAGATTQQTRKRKNTVGKEHSEIPLWYTQAHRPGGSREGHVRHRKYNTTKTKTAASSHHRKTNRKTEW